MSIGSRMRERRESLGMTQMQLADLLGVSKGAIGNFETGRNSPKASNMYKVFEALKCDANYIYQDEIRELDTDDLTVPEIRMVKKYRSLDKPGQEAVDAILDCEHRRCQDERQKLDPEPEKIIYLYHSDQKASAGTGFVLDYEQMNRWAVRYNDLTRKADFCVAVSGQSMEPMFFDGDVILVQTTPSVDIGEVGLFVLDGNGYVKKRGTDRLISLNPDSSDVIPAPLSRLDCMGRVLGVLDPEWVIEN